MTKSTALARLDLNLLVSLLALLEERNVTRAGARLHVTQPAMSAALARLRRHFNDELLSRCDQIYVLTPLAQSLLPVLRDNLAMTERIVSMRWEFDPATASRHFTIMMSDYAQMVLATPLAAAFSQQAPSCVLDLLPLPGTEILDADATLRRVDAVVLPHGFREGYPHLDLFSDSWCVLVAEDNDVLGSHISTDDLLKFPHAAIGTAGDVTLAAKLLAIDNVEPWVQVRTPHFLGLPFLVQDTDRIALVQRRLAHNLCASAQVRIVEITPDLPGLTEAAWWHEVHQTDSGHRWLRDVMSEATQQLKLS